MNSPDQINNPNENITLFISRSSEIVHNQFIIERKPSEAEFRPYSQRSRGFGAFEVYNQKQHTIELSRARIAWLNRKLKYIPRKLSEWKSIFQQNKVGGKITHRTCTCRINVIFDTSSIKSMHGAA